MYLCSMSKRIEALKKNDLIRFVAPAKAIDAKLVENAKTFFEEYGFRVAIGKHTLKQFSYLSGSDSQRLEDMQEALDDPDCKAILCVRGGYGSIRIVDKINWAGFIQQPKWLIGFSDITVFHHQIQLYGLPSIHASMPLNFMDNTPLALSSLLRAFKGQKIEYSYNAHDSYFKPGLAKGRLVGGNLAIVHALLGTSKRLDFNGSILFLEDVGEYIYALDRMLYSLELAGVFDEISGLIIGGMTNISDTNPPLGYDLVDIIREKTWFRSFPVCMNFPAGHIDDNRALVLGEPAILEVGDMVRFEQTRELI